MQHVISINIHNRTEQNIIYVNVTKIQVLKFEQVTQDIRVMTYIQKGGGF
jgi:hypothetical protein